MMIDDVLFLEVCCCLEEVGVVVVGVNCGRGFCIMLFFVKEIKKVCKVSKCIMIVYKKKNILYIKLDFILRLNSSFFVMFLDYIVDSYCVIFLEKKIIYYIV